MGVLQLPSSAARKARSVTTATRVSSWLRPARYLAAGSSLVLQAQQHSRFSEQHVARVSSAAAAAMLAHVYSDLITVKHGCSTSTLSTASCCCRPTASPCTSMHIKPQLQQQLQLHLLCTAPNLEDHLYAHPSCALLTCTRCRWRPAPRLAAFNAKAACALLKTVQGLPPASTTCVCAALTCRQCRWRPAPLLAACPRSP